MFSKSACLIVLSGVIVTAPLLSNALLHMSGERYYAFSQHPGISFLDLNRHAAGNVP